MAAILSVTYTPNYIGCHRICFKTTQDAYCCYQDDSPSSIGVEKTTQVTLDNYSDCLVDVPFQIGCNDINLIGYIQPCCTDSTSLENRITFATTYQVTPCTPYKIECTESGIAEIVLTNQGYGWLPLQVPNITITDTAGYGVGATAEAVMACTDANICYVESISITNPGNFYYFPDQITINIDLPTDPGGTPAEAHVATVDDCGTFTVPNCDGTANPTTYSLLGAPEYATNVCASGLGPEAFKYSVTPNPVGISCCDCTQYNVVVRNPIDIYYTDCTQTIVTASIEAGGAGITICAVPGSIWAVNRLDSVSILGIIDQGPCTLA